MMESLQYFWGSDLPTVIRLVLALFLVGHLLHFRKNAVLRVALSACVCLLWSVFFHRWSIADPASILIRSIIKYLTLFSLTFVLVWFCLRIEAMGALFCVTVSYCLEHMAQRIPGLLWLVFPAVPEGVVRTISGFAIMAGLYALLYRMLIQHFLCREGDNYKDNRMLLYLAIVVIAMDIVISTIGIDISARNGTLGSGWVLHVFSVLCSFLVLIISMCNMRMKAAEKEALIVEQLLYSERAQFKRDNAVIDMINIKCHDLKHQIAMIETKLDRQELEDIRSAIDIYDSSIQTGNTALDVVLCNKTLLCKGQQIRLTCAADGSLIDFLREADIYSLFSNILDNAIESVSRLEQPENRVITLTIHRERGFVFIHEENYFSGDLSFTNGLPNTIKTDKKHHGFGMLSTRTLVEKYNGDLQIHAESGIFKLDIMLPIPT